MRAVWLDRAGRLPRASIFVEMKPQGSTLHSAPGLAIPSTVQGFTPSGHRDSSLYRSARLSRNV